MHQPNTVFSHPSWLVEALASVEEILRHELPEGLQHLLSDKDFGLSEREFFPLRPSLLLMVARHYGCCGPRALRLAAGIQMIHFASLLHERLGCVSMSSLIEADPDKARHQQESMDILLGDFFFSKASCIIIEDGDQKIIEDMIRTSLASAEAQARIVSLDDDPGSKEPSHCFTIVAEKQALFIALALRVGAVLGDAASEEIESLSRFGDFWGKAWRIVQDVEFWENPPASEIPLSRERKYSHPLLLFWEDQGPEAWLGIVNRLRETERNHLTEVRTRIKEQGYLRRSCEKAGEYAETGILQLDREPGLKGFDEMKTFAREYLFRNVGPTKEMSP